MLKVLYICPNGYLGGAERFVLDAVTAHAEKGKIEASIFFFKSGEATDIAAARTLQHTVLPFKLRLSRIFALAKTILYLRHYIKTNNIDIVHNTMSYGHIVGWASQIFLPTECVWFQHGPVGGILDRLACFLPVNRIFYNSQFLMDEHLKYDLVNSDKDKHLVIPLGTPDNEPSPQQVSAIRSEFLSQDTQKLVLLAGRICEWKGFETYINALATLKRETDTATNLITLIAGDAKLQSDQAYMNKLKTLVQTHNLQDTVHFLGYCDNMPDYYGAADLFVHTSKIPEPFGLAVAEAMIQRCLVVGGTKGGISELLKNGYTGITYDTTADDAEKRLKEILKPIASNKFREDSTVIQSNAHEFVKQNFSIAGMTEALESNYNVVFTPH